MKKKSGLIFLILFYILSISFSSVPAKANSIEGIKFIKVEKKNLLIPNSQTITVSLNDNSWVKRVLVNYKNPDGYNQVALYRNNEVHLSDAEFKGDTMSYFASEGDWSVVSLLVEKLDGSWKYYGDIEDGGMYQLDDGNFSTYSSDIEGPVFNSIHVDNPAVLPGGSVIVTVNAQDKLSDIQSISLEYKLPNNMYMSLSPTSIGNNQYQLNIPSYLTSGNQGLGKFECVSITLKDAYNNNTLIIDHSYYSTGDLSGGDFVVAEKDTTAPVSPIINEVTDQSTSVTGTAEAGSVVTVKAGITVLGTATATSEGNYAAMISQQKAGTKLLVTATDEAGNISEAVEVTVKDVTAPGVPSVNEITETTTEVTGTAEVGTTISVKAETTVLGTTKTGTDGKYSVPIPKQAAGTNIIVIATDAAGNSSETVTVTVKDKTAPSAPTVNEVTDQSTSVTGTAEAGSVVTVKAGSMVLGTATATNDGKYTVVIAKQKAGTKLAVTATDAAGNVSKVTEVTVKDKTAPSSPTVNEVTETSTSVTGTAEAGSVVAVKAGSMVLGTAVATSEGKYTVMIVKQKAGTKLAVTATDAAGNVSATTEVTVKDVTAPSPPTVNEVTETFTSVTGTAEIGAIISVKVGTIVLGTANTGMDGKYSVPLLKQKAGTNLTVIATDAAGNSSETVTVTVKRKDTTAPSTPKVNEVTDQSISVTGLAEAGTEITVKTGSTILGAETATTEGKYAVTITKQKVGTKLTVIATDTSGNISKAANVIVQDKTAPTAPIVNLVSDLDKTVTGTAEAGSTVIVKAAGNKKTYKATVKKDGTYKVTIAAQKAGTIVEVTAIDKNGNVSSPTIVTVLDKTAPAVPKVNVVNDQDERVTGTAEANSTVTVKVGNTVLGTAAATSEGKYTATINKRKEGTVLTVTATDAAGNTSKAGETTVKDGTPPAAPTVNPISDRDKIVTGTAEAGSNVIVRAAGSKKTYKASVKKDGTYKVTIALQKAGTIIEVTATDKQGNISIPTTVSVQDKAALAKLKIHP